MKSSPVAAAAGLLVGTAATSSSSESMVFDIMSCSRGRGAPQGGGVMLEDALDDRDGCDAEDEKDAEAVAEAAKEEALSDMELSLLEGSAGPR